MNASSSRRRCAGQIGELAFEGRAPFVDAVQARVLVAAALLALLELAGQQPTARLGELALDGAQLLGGVRLAAQRRQLRGELALHQFDALEIAAHFAQLQLGALAAPLVAPQAGGLLDQRRGDRPAC